MRACNPSSIHSTREGLTHKRHVLYARGRLEWNRFLLTHFVQFLNKVLVAGPCGRCRFRYSGIVLHTNTGDQCGQWRAVTDLFSGCIHMQVAKGLRRHPVYSPSIVGHGRHIALYNMVILLAFVCLFAMAFICLERITYIEVKPELQPLTWRYIFQLRDIESLIFYLHNSSSPWVRTWRTSRNICVREDLH